MEAVEAKFWAKPREGHCTRSNTARLGTKTKRVARETRRPLLVAIIVPLNWAGVLTTDLQKSYFVRARGAKPQNPIRKFGRGSLLIYQLCV